MDIQNIFMNGLPQELKSLQDGQIYIFSSPDEGAKEKKVMVCQYISALAGQNKIKKENRPAVFIIPTDNADLWEYMFCLVENPNGKFLEIADLSTLTEMVYDLLGLNLKDNPPIIADRHKKNNITISDSHPVRIPLYKTDKKSDTDGEKSDDTSYDWLSPSLSYLTNKSLSADDVRKTVLTALFEAEYNKDRFGVDYSVDELLKDFYAEKEKTYSLEIVPEIISGNLGSRRIIDCHIYITDGSGKKGKELIMKAQEKAVYLMFVLYEDGISINDFPKEKKKKTEEYSRRYITLLNLYTKIQDQLLNKNFIEEPQLLQGDITPIRNKIRNKIASITANKKYIDMFAIEGYAKEPFKVAGATDEHRKSIIEAFGIDPQKYGL